VADAFKPQLAILDIGLPDIDGYKLLSALRNRLVNRLPYLVAITGWIGELKPALEAGFDECLLKPAGLAQFLRAAELAQRRQAGP
jgi:DNA-binding response OmpR family regulator